MVCVRYVHVTSTSPPPDREGAAARAAAGGSSAARRRSRSDSGGAAGLHPDAGRQGARREPLNVRSERAPVPRDGRDAVGHEADPRRRAGAACRATAPGCASTTAAGDTRPPASGFARARPPPPRRACCRQEPRSDRPRPQRRRHSGGARRCAVVAVHHPSSRSSATVGRASAHERQCGRFAVGGVGIGNLETGCSADSARRPSGVSHES